MTQVPQKPLVPNNTLMTKTPEEGRALALMLARNSIHAIQGELETLKAGRAQYAHDPFGLIAASHVVAVEFATIAAGAGHRRRQRRHGFTQRARAKARHRLQHARRVSQGVGAENDPRNIRMRCTKLLWRHRWRPKR